MQHILVDKLIRCCLSDCVPCRPEESKQLSATTAETFFRIRR
jgi:hypothetical protein